MTVRFEGVEQLAQLAGAALRAVLMVWLVSMPSLMLPSIASDTAQMVMIMGLIVGLLVFIEYFGRYPSILEFRYAAPYNRLKFGFAFFAIIFVSLHGRGMFDSTPLSDLVTRIGAATGAALDFPYSPIRTLMTMLPAGATETQAEALRLIAGVSYALSLCMIATFLVIVKVTGWPVRYGAFNVCVNLPLFDPSGGGDVVERLYRDAALNVSLGIALPFLIPVAMLGFGDFVERVRFLNPQNMIWITVLWAFLPASMVMRGVAMHRIGTLISNKRRQAYARSEDESAELQAV